jgi:lipoprotein-anchoring transpeptidase ErfK/SrfK
LVRRLLLLIVVVGATMPALGGAAAPPDLIAAGVTVAGIPVGGMSSEEAQAAVAPSFARPVRLVYGTRQWLLRPERFGSRVSIVDGVTRALAAPARTQVALVPRLDVARVRTFVAALDRRLSYPAQDAHLAGLSGLTPVIAAGKPGLRVLRGPTVERIVHAAQSAQRPRIRVAVERLAPQRTPAAFGPVVVVRRGVNELRYYDGTKLVRTFPVATGQAIYPTPLGTWSIVDMQRNPWWRPPTQDVWARGLKPVPPGPGNPLGTRWMGLSAPGVGIHGTPDDASVGYSASHGCIRMHIPDAEWLFEHVQLGTPVVIVDR